MSTLDVYHELQKKLVATPSRAHCTFNFHDLSHVFAGMSLLSLPRGAVIGSQTATVSVTRLWCHELVRTFADRLLTREGNVLLNCMSCVNSSVIIVVDVVVITSLFSSLSLSSFLSSSSLSSLLSFSPSSLSSYLSINVIVIIRAHHHHLHSHHCHCDPAPPLHPCLPCHYSPFSDRQHLSYDVYLEVRAEIIRTVLCCIVY